MTLRDEIHANQSCAEFIAAKDCDAIAAIISVGRVRANMREIGNGTVLEVLGIVAGNALLDEINTNAVYRYVRPLVEQGRLLIGSALVQATVQSMVPAVLTQAQADALCTLGRELHAYTVLEIHEALFNHDGSEK